MKLETSSTIPTKASSEAAIKIKKLSAQNSGEFLDLLRVFGEAFDAGKTVFTKHQHLRKLEDDVHFIVLVAKDKSGVVGGLTAHVLNNYGLPEPSVYIYDVAVQPAYQRQGIGKRLVAALMEYCAAKNYKEIFVQAEADDVDAINFYRCTPISGEMNATQFYYTLTHN